MKHLKLYKESSDILYTYIDHTQLEDILYNQKSGDILIDFTENEYIKIKKTFDEISNDKYKFTISPSYTKTQTSRSKTIKVEIKNEHELFLSILKLPDEWYIITDYYSIYNNLCVKCDQIEGLINFIKTKTIKQIDKCNLFA